MAVGGNWGGHQGVDEGAFEGNGQSRLGSSIFALGGDESCALTISQEKLKMYVYGKSPAS